MYKADVEWLYNQVKVGTPVHVLYETVQVQTGPAGQKYLAIYPDIYGRGSPRVADVLARAGYAPDAVEPKGPGLYLLDPTALVNGSVVTAVFHQGRPYLAARELGRLLSADVSWDDAARAVRVDGQPVRTLLKGSAGYVDAGEAAAVLGVEYQYNAETGTALLSGRPLFLNGHLLNRQGQALGDEVYLPVRAVAEAAGAQVGWDNEARQAVVNAELLPSVLRGTRAYAKPGVLAARLNLRVRAIGQAIHLDG